MGAFITEKILRENPELVKAFAGLPDQVFWVLVRALFADCRAECNDEQAPVAQPARITYYGTQGLPNSCFVFLALKVLKGRNGAQ